MTIEKGELWGRPGRLPADGIEVHSDAEARKIIERARRDGTAIPLMGLRGGDLCRTVGGRGDGGRLRSEEAMTLPVDLGSVLLDGKLHWFIAHLVCRSPLWTGRTVAVMNAQWIGTWDVAPRSHPNDGLLDVFDVSMSLGDRLKARRRLATGTHVPHPSIIESRVAAVQLEFDRPTPVFLDGEQVGRARRISARIEPDALQVVV